MSTSFLNHHREPLPSEQREWQLITIVECSIHGALILQSNQIRFANRSALRLLELTGDQLKSIDFATYLNRSMQCQPYFSTDKILADSERALQEEIRIRLVRSDQKQIWLRIWGIEIAYDGDTAILLNFMDITKNKETEMQLLRQEKMATIGQLAAGIAHEINTPLAYIQSNLVVLQQYMENIKAFYTQCHKLTETQQYCDELDADFLFPDIDTLLKENLEGSRQIAHIIRDLRQFASIDTDNDNWFEVQEILEATLNVLNNQLKYHVHIVRDYEPNLPKIYGNSQDFGQIFMNLIINSSQAIAEKAAQIGAIPASYQGEITLRTRLGSQNENSIIKVSVIDNGTGISEENLKKIFDPFFTTKQIGQGSGLGLSIVFDIITKNGGQVQVESQPGQGTAIHISIPLKGAKKNE